MYTLGKLIQGRKEAGLTTSCFFQDIQKAYDSMEEWVVETYVRYWCQRKDVENGEKYYGICEKCCDAGGVNIKIC